MLHFQIPYKLFHSEFAKFLLEHSFSYAILKRAIFGCFDHRSRARILGWARSASEPPGPLPTPIWLLYIIWVFLLSARYGSVSIYWYVREDLCYLMLYTVYNKRKKWVQKYLIFLSGAQFLSCTGFTNLHYCTRVRRDTNECTMCSFRYQFCSESRKIFHHMSL